MSRELPDGPGRMFKGLLCAPLFLAVSMSAGCFLLEDETVQKVKHGRLSGCPEKTLGEMADGFMASPSWSSGKTAQGDAFVNLEGKIMYAEKEVTGLIQFKFNKDDTFEFNALEFNGAPQNALIAGVLLQKMCTDS